MSDAQESSDKAQKARDKRDLTRGSVPGHLLRLSGPMVIGIVSVILFNLVDTYYVSRLGAEALTAISFTFPVVSFIGSVSIGLGIAVASMVSRNLGAGNRKVAEEQTTQGIAFAVVFVIFVSVVGLYTIGPLFRALGASGEDLVLIRSYMEIWYFGAAFVVVPMVGNSAIRASGDTRSPAFIMLFAGLSNAVLDPLLIFGLGPFPEMGIRGAAVATVTSRGLTLILSLWILHYREKLLRIAALTAMKRIVVNLREFLVIGIPAAITQSITPITVGILTRILSEFGDDTVAAFGAGSRVEMVLLILPFSLAAGMAPFVGQNYGAERRDRLGKALRISLMTGAAMGVVLWLVMLPLAGPIAAIFSEEVTIRNEIQWFLWIVPAGHAAQHVFFLVNSMFNAIGDAWKGTLLASARTFIYILGLALLLSHFYGALGVFIGVAVGNVFTAVTSLYVSRNLWLPSKTKAP